MTAPTLLAGFDPFSLEYLANPYSTLALIRQTSPALYVERYGFFLITRYEDVVHASRRHDIFSSTGGVGIEWKSRPMMPMYDPPKHTQLRRIVQPFFTPKAVQAYAAAVRTAAEEAVDRVLAGGPLDVIREVAEPISLVTLATILGIPKEHQADLRRWADNTMADLAGGASNEEAERLELGRREFVGYLRATIEQRRQSKSEDLISVLLRANDAERLTEKEVLAFCVLLLVAGFEPSASAIGNVCRALALHVPELDALPSGEEELSIAGDELLRWDSPVQAFFRNTMAETTVGGVAIPKDAKVMIHFAAANRDPSVFRDPDVLDLHRNPNPHIAFGAGIHHCLGAPLARLQVSTFLSVLRAKVRHLEMVETARRHDNLLFRGLGHARMRFEAR